MLPPWRKYPEIPIGSIGWRMGYGEDYGLAFSRWFKELSDPAAETFVMENPEAGGWEGFYTRLRSQA